MTSSVNMTSVAAISGTQNPSLPPSSDGRSSPTNSVQSSLRYGYNSDTVISTTRDLQAEKRSFKERMKGLFSRKKVGDKSSKNENSNKVGTTEKKVERITGQKRLFYINDQERNNLIAPQTPNYIRTTKYTLWTFLPLSLMFQFKRLPNFYFLIQAILNSITIVSAMNPISAYLPLAFG